MCGHEPSHSSCTCVVAIACSIVFSEAVQTSHGLVARACGTSSTHVTLTWSLRLVGPALDSCWMESRTSLRCSTSVSTRIRPAALGFLLAVHFAPWKRTILG